MACKSANIPDYWKEKFLLLGNGNELLSLLFIKQFVIDGMLCATYLTTYFEVLSNRWLKFGCNSEHFYRPA